MDQTTMLIAEMREKTGKGIARRLRAQKKIPAVLYGPHMDQPLNIAVDPKALRLAVQGPRRLNTLITLDLGEAGKHVALLKDYQKHPVTDELLHADFYEVRLDRPIRVAVPVILEGRPEGVVQGGILSQIRRTITVECLPENIPDQIVVDVTHLKMGEALHIADIQPPEGVRIRYVNNYTVAVVTTTEDAAGGAAA